MPPLASLELERRTRWMVGPKGTNELKCATNKSEEPRNLTNCHRSLNSPSSLRLWNYDAKNEPTPEEGSRKPVPAPPIADNTSPIGLSSESNEKLDSPCTAASDEREHFCSIPSPYP
jgi:hypothetical protein